jgi:hypothetical protein
MGTLVAMEGANCFDAGRQPLAELYIRFCLLLSWKLLEAPEFWMCVMEGRALQRAAGAIRIDRDHIRTAINTSDVPEADTLVGFGKFSNSLVKGCCSSATIRDCCP